MTAAVALRWEPATGTSQAWALAMTDDARQAYHDRGRLDPNHDQIGCFCCCWDCPWSTLPTPTGVAVP